MEKADNTIDWKLKGSQYEMTTVPSEINAHILLFCDGKWVFVIRIDKDVPSRGWVISPNYPLIL